MTENPMTDKMVALAATCATQAEKDAYKAGICTALLLLEGSIRPKQMAPAVEMLRYFIARLP